MHGRQPTQWTACGGSRPVSKAVKMLTEESVKQKAKGRETRPVSSAKAADEEVIRLVASLSWGSWSVPWIWPI